MNILIRYLGYILVISGLFRIVPIITAVIYGESMVSYVISMSISIFLGGGLIWIEKKRDSTRLVDLTHLNLPNALVLVTISFLILPVLGAISFLPSFGYNIVDAIFESISGFTTTGFTLYNSVETLPHSLLLWRAMTQWIGGIGIVMIFLFIISRLKYHGGEEETKIETTAALYQAQGFDAMESSLKKSTRNVLLIYGGYTLLGILLLYSAGMSLFEAVALAITSLSTGGFIVTDSLQATNLQLGILSALMLLGSISFIVHNKLLQKRFKEFFLSYEKNVFLVYLGISVIITLAVFTDLKVIIFQMISAFTTTGYSISDISMLPALFVMLMISGMLIGGSIASTSGGMKTSRIYIILKMMPWMVRKISSPRHAIIPLKIKGKQIEEKDLLIIVVFVSLFLLCLFLGTIIFLMLGYAPLDSVFQMASALGTVGLQTIDLITVPVIGKIVLIIAMLLGRLEIFPLLILMKKVWRWASLKL